jgi:hypothetical protein
MLDNVSTVAAGDNNSPAANVSDAEIISESGPVKSQYHTIAILGSHPATVETAPFDDPGVMIYACSPHNIEMRTLPRWDEWFEIHQPAIHPTRTYDYIRRLEDQARKKDMSGEKPVVWMRDQTVLQHMPGGRLYPEAEMKNIFCPFMFTSSIAFIFAKAIVDAERLGVKKIGMWGILQKGPQEYERQRPGTQYFIWEATRRGIKVLAAQESGLFEPPPEDF